MSALQNGPRSTLVPIPRRSKARASQNKARVGHNRQTILFFSINKMWQVHPPAPPRAGPSQGPPWPSGSAISPLFLSRYTYSYRIYTIYEHNETREHAHIRQTANLKVLFFSVSHTYFSFFLCRNTNRSPVRISTALSRHLGRYRYVQVHVVTCICPSSTL